MTNRSRPYVQEIVSLLTGEAPELASIASDHLDWAGVSSFLELYGRTAGEDRESMVNAISDIIGDPKQQPVVRAQLVQIASALDISQVEPSVRKLSHNGAMKERIVKEAVENFFAFRQLARHPRVPGLPIEE